MNYGQLKKALKALVDRPDMPLDQAGEFIQRAIANLERSRLRLGFQKKLLERRMNGRAFKLKLPYDYLETIDLFDDVHPDSYGMTALTTWRKTPEYSHKPLAVTVEGDLWLRPTPGPQTTVSLHYYAEAPKLSVDTDENGWSKSASEAVIYTAARMAADFYQIDDGAKWGLQADREIALIQEQDDAEEWSGDLSIALPYPNIC